MRDTYDARMACQEDQIFAELLEYADFEETGSPARARKFIIAAKRYLILSPTSQADQGSSMTLSIPQIESLLKSAQVYARANDPGNSRVRHLGASRGFRG